MKMLLLCLTLLCTFGFACSASPKDDFTEHADGAGMQCCASFTVFTVDSGNTVTATQKQLPWQSDMAAYALSFALPDTNVRYSVAITDGQAAVNISQFPTYATAVEENAAVAAIVNTMLSYPGVNSVLLRFDDCILNMLPHGTKADNIFITFCSINKMSTQ